jgi:hypothetical protein
VYTCRRLCYLFRSPYFIVDILPFKVDAMYAYVQREGPKWRDPHLGIMHCTCAVCHPKGRDTVLRLGASAQVRKKGNNLGATRNVESGQ